MSNEKVVFVRKSHSNHHHGEYNHLTNDIDDMIELDKLLKNTYPNLDYEIIVVITCETCFVEKRDVPNTIKIHDISKTFMQNPDYNFNELCKKILP